MRIGIDLRPLQTGHKYRGIGEVTKQVVGRVLRKGLRDGVEYVFYEYDDSDPKEFLGIPRGLIYSVVKLGKMPEDPKNIFTWKQKFKRRFGQLYGNPITDTGALDAFLQFDYAFGVPKNTKTVLVIHDFIPYIFWRQYFESAWVPFRNHALRTTLRTLFANYSYLRVLKRSLRRAYSIVTVSHSTEEDAKRLFRVPAKKLQTIHLGVSLDLSKTDEDAVKVNLPTKPYLLFIGAGDARRRVDELVFAYNNLKADGYDIQLALVGENFRTKEGIPNAAVRREVLGSSYSDDILTLGYVDDATKHDLYKKAIAYAYPTKYEGFGIPILEAMLLGGSIITYDNSSTHEVGGKHALYAYGWLDLVEQTKVLLHEPKKDRTARLASAKKYAEDFTWDKTAKSIYDEIIRVARR